MNKRTMWILNRALFGGTVVVGCVLTILGRLEAAGIVFAFAGMHLARSPLDPHEDVDGTPGA